MIFNKFNIVKQICALKSPTLYRRKPLASNPYHFLREVIFGNYRVIFSKSKLQFTVTIISVVNAKQNIYKMPIKGWVIES